MPDRRTICRGTRRTLPRARPLEILDSFRASAYLPASSWHSPAQSASRSARSSLSVNHLAALTSVCKDIQYGQDQVPSPARPRGRPQRIDGEDKTKGGIIIPDTAKEKPQEGEVIAVGPGARDESGKLVALDVKAGDRVLFGKWSGTEVKIDGEELLIMKESDIMGVIDDDPAMREAVQDSRLTSETAIAS